MAGETLMVIFGAGASFDSSRTETRESEYRPPLTRDLFEAQRSYSHLLQYFPLARGIVNQLRRSQHIVPPPTIESVLGELRDHGSDQDRLSLDASRYYVRAAIGFVAHHWFTTLHGVTLYQELVHQIEGWRCAEAGRRVLYVSFNYDDLIERALTDENILQIRFLDDYADPNSHTSLLKPHGSTNWWREPGANLVRFDSRWWPDPNRVHEWASAQEPVIAIPVEEKPESELLWPSRQQTLFAQIAPTVTSVLVIGWRASEQHFVRIMAERLPATVPFRLVCADGAAETVDNLEAAGFQETIPIRFDERAHAGRSVGFAELMQHGGLDLRPNLAARGVS
jgi:hypothetical protein